MTAQASDRPAIHLLAPEADRLYDLATKAMQRQPDVAKMLLAEIDRAEIHDAGTLPDGVISMLSTVEFVDESNGTSRTVQLVYPADADIAAGRVSILTPIGAGLIGLSEGQSILWPDREGRERRLRIVRVRPAAGGKEASTGSGNGSLSAPRSP